MPGSPARDADRYVMYAAIEELLEAASSAQPLLLVLEDLHWADAPTVLLLRRLLTSPRSARLAILCTARTQELAEDHALVALLADLHREAGVWMLELGGLRDPDVHALVESMTDLALDAAGRRFASALYENTAGNPFFITQLVRSLAESGDLSFHGRTV